MLCPILRDRTFHSPPHRGGCCRAGLRWSLNPLFCDPHATCVLIACFSTGGSSDFLFRESRVLTNPQRKTQTRTKGLHTEKQKNQPNTHKQTYPRPRPSNDKQQQQQRRRRDGPWQGFAVLPWHCCAESLSSSSSALHSKGGAGGTSSQRDSDSSSGAAGKRPDAGRSRRQGVRLGSRHLGGRGWVPSAAP